MEGWSRFLASCRRSRSRACFPRRFALAPFPVGTGPGIAVVSATKPEKSCLYTLLALLSAAKCFPLTGPLVYHLESPSPQTAPTKTSPLFQLIPHPALPTPTLDVEQAQAMWGSP